MKAIGGWREISFAILLDIGWFTTAIILPIFRENNLNVGEEYSLARTAMANLGRPYGTHVLGELAWM